MKKNQFLWATIVAIVAMFMLVFSACEKVPMPDFDQDEPSHLDGTGILKISVNHQDPNLKSLMMNDTLIVEGDKVLSFAYTSAITMTSQMWTFHDGSTSSSKIASYLYWGFNVKPITLTTWDASGNSYQIITYINLFPRVGGDPVIWTGSSPMGGNNYQVNFAIYKNGIVNHASNYLVKGSVTPTPWAGSLTVPTADTNFRFYGNQFLPPATGDIGHWIKVSVNIPVGFHQMAVYKNVSGSELWGNFKGSQYITPANTGLISFYLGTGGTVSSQQTADDIPGEGGDTGSNPVVRLSVSGSNNVTVFLNNGANFTSITPFKRHLQPDQTWIAPISLQAVTNNPNWGKFTAPITAFPQAVRFGSNISQPNNYNSNSSNSMFWNSFYGYLDIAPVIVNGHLYEGLGASPKAISLIVNQQ